MQNQVFEPVQVIAHFHGLHIEIIRFKWKKSVFNVSKVNSTWKVPSGNGYVYHYSVICEKQNVICELAFDMGSFKWELVQYDDMPEAK